MKSPKHFHIAVFGTYTVKADTLVDAEKIVLSWFDEANASVGVEESDVNDHCEYCAAEPVSVYNRETGNDIEVMDPTMKKLLKQKFGSSWCGEDVYSQALDNDIELTPSQLLSIMDHLNHNHDATVGINWDVIDYAIKHILDAEKKQYEEEKHDEGDA